MPTETEMVAAIERAFTIGPYAAMCMDEEARGFKPVVPGMVSWLPGEEWPDDVVITQKGDEVRIVAIYAKQPGNGAFRKLIADIIRAGLRPKIICPTIEMRETLKRWNWRQRYTGSTFQDREEEWFPQRKFIEQCTRDR